MKRSRKKWLVPPLVGSIWLLGVLVGELVQESSLGRRAELFSYDLRFRLRGELTPSAGRDIALVVIDEESFDRIPEPLILWQGHLGRVIEALVGAGASAIGIDLVLPDVSSLDSAGQRQLLGALLQAEAEAVPIRLVYRAGDSGDARLPSSLAMVLGGGGFAYANLTTDEDDFVRRQQLIADQPGGPPAPGFAAALAQCGGYDVERALALDPMLINYRGRDPFSRVPFWRVLEAALEDDVELADSFGGKTVLIGVQDEGDLHPTPLYYWPTDSDFPFRRTPGLFIHAHALSTIIEGNYLEPVGSPVQRLLAMGLIFLVTLAAWRFSPLVALLVSAGTLGIYVAAAMTWVFSSGLVLSVVGPAAGGLTAFALSQSAQYVLVGREKRQIRSLFGRYVNESVIEEILQRHESLVLTGEKRPVTILFSDIRNFTTLSEEMDAGDLVGLLNRYLEGMVAEIHRQGGMVDKFIGDAIMAVFGAPMVRSEHAGQAVRAAFGMLEALAELNRQFESEGIARLKIGIGIHSGEAIIGNVGSRYRMEYTAIGDVVNTASRLERLTKQADAALLVSRDTFELLPAEISGESLGQIPLKGKKVPVEVIRIHCPVVS